MGICNAEKTFQCYDGTCIPKHASCDGKFLFNLCLSLFFCPVFVSSSNLGYFDCPGFFHEDEDSGCPAPHIPLLSANHYRKTCQELILDNITKNGFYWIDADGNGPLLPFKVYNLFSAVNNW